MWVNREKASPILLLIDVWGSVLIIVTSFLLVFARTGVKSEG